MNATHAHNFHLDFSHEVVIALYRGCLVFN